jgi:hypothetical protein
VVMQWTWVDGLLIEIFVSWNERVSEREGRTLSVSGDKLEINQRAKLTNKSLLIG